VKTNRKRENNQPDEKKSARVRTILGAKTETEAVDPRWTRSGSGVKFSNHWEK
jgi:hypothetical protein